jgi:hypothetical protein
MKLIEFPKPASEGPDQDLIEMAEKLLERAKAGEVTDFVVAGLDNEGDTFILFAADHLKAHGLLALALKAI